MRAVKNAHPNLTSSFALSYRSFYCLSSVLIWMLLDPVTAHHGLLTGLLSWHDANHPNNPLEVSL